MSPYVRCSPADDLLYRGSHRVKAAVDVEKLPGGGWPPVREQADDGPSDGFGVGRLPAQRSLASPLAFDLFKAADAFRGERLDRARRDEVDPNAASPEVAGEVARGAFQGGLGHPHPVVGRPGDPGVEV